MPPLTHQEKVDNLITQSVVLRRANRHDDTLACLDEAARLAPDSLSLLVLKGITLKTLTRHEEAIACFERVLARRPDLHEVQRMRHNTLLAILECHERAIHTQPDAAEAYFNRGNALQRLCRHAEAVDSYNRTLEIENAHVDAIIQRGNALIELNRHEDALACYDRALQLSPVNANTLCNRGNVLMQLNRFEEALPCYEQALARKSDLAEAAMGQSHCRLAMGDFQSGWLLYEWRWKTHQMREHKLHTDAPLWLGEEPLARKTVLIWAEQGFGDTIHFARYVPLVARHTGHVIVRAPSALRSLLETLRGGGGSMTFITGEEPLPPHDFHCPLMSLPLAFGTTRDTIPVESSYLRADPKQVAKWRERLGPRGKPRIGIVWAGRQYGSINRTRDMRLAHLTPLASVSVELISMQKQIPQADWSAAERIPCSYRVGESLTDFADTAALIANLDLVLGVDTAVAHLAGALGKPVWVMVKHSGEWRWPLGCVDSPWYPSARIFRQKIRDDWSAVVQDVTRQLKILFGA